MAVVINIRMKIPVWLDKICARPILLCRQFKYGYPFRKIPLGDSKYSLVDPRDFYWLNKYQWIAYGKSDCPYAVRFACSSRGKVISFAMHREIMNPPPGLLVDHQNSNTLDNRRDNLRLATHWQNTCNRRKTKS
ncbi:MAG: HNH endonuclease, partial [Sedimentisphaerales bacterium]|nr:HNH endonuclease [Sedimentisphaerales bacterium]